ncbi:SH2 domain-containing protein 4A isoform X2 [Pleurodeles waltl]
MLKQILTDMYIEPDLLAELSEEQKQILFFKMREEQIRRWKERESVYEENNSTQRESRLRKCKSNKSSVKWLIGADNEVWVWVMGEHPSDKPYDILCEEIIKGREEEQAQASVDQRKAEENLHIPKKVPLHCQQNIADRNQEQADQETPADIQKGGVMPKKQEDSIRRQQEPNTQKHQQNCKDVLRVVDNLVKEDAEWQESLRKSKAADLRRRSVAKSAIEDYKRLSLQAIERGKVVAEVLCVEEGKRPPIPPKPKKENLESKKATFTRRHGVKRTMSSSNREDIIKWFKEEQLPLQAGYNKSGDHIASWFHGIISRPEAEDMLNTGSAGSFLIRISEKIKGYVLSFRSEDGYKHFMIDASCNSYSFLGVDQLQHATLADLVAYHKAYHGHFFLNISELFQYTKGSPI